MHYQLIYLGLFVLQFDTSQTYKHETVLWKMQLFILPSSVCIHGVLLLTAQQCFNLKSRFVCLVVFLNDVSNRCEGKQTYTAKCKFKWESVDEKYAGRESCKEKLLLAVYSRICITK